MTHEWLAWLAAITVSAIVGWCYGQQSGWKDGYMAGKDVAQRMMENQDRWIEAQNKTVELIIIKKGKK